MPQNPPIIAGTRIGHVHLKVADLDRALAFYCDVLGFELIQRMGEGGLPLGRRLPPPHRAQHLGEQGRLAAAARHHRALSRRDPLSRLARRSADALRRLIAAGIPLDGASDHGVSEALYLRDPDGNGVELYRDRPAAEWPRAAMDRCAMFTKRLDLEGLLRQRGEA